MSRIAENIWMLGYFACLLLSVIHVLSDEVSRPEALQILCHVWYCFPCCLSMIGGVMFL
jgi:hypothetical protein